MERENDKKMRIDVEFNRYDCKQNKVKTTLSNNGL